jgi:hypothetical protein
MMLRSAKCLFKLSAFVKKALRIFGNITVNIEYRVTVSGQARLGLIEGVYFFCHLISFENWPEFNSEASIGDIGRDMD